MASLFSTTKLSVQDLSFSRTLRRCESPTFARLAPAPFHHTSSLSRSSRSAVIAAATPVLECSQPRSPTGMENSTTQGLILKSGIQFATGSPWHSPEEGLPPLSYIGDHMVQLLRVPGRRPSQYAGEAEQAVMRLATERWGMDSISFAMYNRIGVWFSSFVFPSTVSAERLSAVCIHQSLFALLDDLCFDTDGLEPASFGLDAAIVKDSPRVGEFFQRVDRIFRTLELPSQHPTTTVDRAILDAGTDLRRLGGPDWHRHFADAVEDFVDSCVTLQADLAPAGPRESVRDLQSYTRIRSLNSGVLHVCLLMEVACEAVLPAEVRAHPSIQRLVWLCSEIISFVNDIFSYHKDVVTEGSEFNLVKVIMDTEGKSFDQAVRRAMELVRAATRSFADIEASLPQWESPEADRVVRRYVRSLRECIVGNYHFHGGINRYRSPDSPFPELRMLL